MTLGANNEKIQSAMSQLSSEIIREQSKIQSVKGPDAGKEDLVSQELAKYQTKRGKGFFFNYLSSGKGSGPFTELIDGSVKYDLINGIGPSILGHGHKAYIDGVIEAAAVDTVMCGNLQTYEAPKRLTDYLLDHASKDSKLAHFWFSGSGSFANDVALKLLWQKAAPKYNLIAFEKAFAGRSVATQDITYNQSYRVGMPELVNVRHVPHYDQKAPGQAIDKTIKALDEVWNKEPDSFCGLMIEMIQGEGGFVYGPREYYVAIFEWARSKKIPIWIDEVQTFGRTHELFSFQMYDLGEYVDIVTIAKALQCAGTLYTEELNPKPGLIAGTFNGSIASLCSGYYVLKELCENGYYGSDGKMKQLEQAFFKRLQALMDGSCKNKITYYGGVGSMIAFEVGDSSKEFTTSYVKKLFDNGIISFVAGQDPTRVRFLLPAILTEAHMDDIFKIIEKTTLELVK